MFTVIVVLKKSFYNECCVKKYVHNNCVLKKFIQLSVVLKEVSLKVIIVLKKRV